LPALLADPSLAVADCPTLEVCEGDPSVVFTGRQNAIAFLPSVVDTHAASTVVYLSVGLLELSRQTHGYFTLHAAGAALKDDRGVLLLGKEGAGKTSTLIQLARRHGARIVGNDLIACGGAPVELCAGTASLFLREASVDRSLSDVGLPRPPRHSIDPWRTKWRVDAHSLGFETATDVALAVVCFVHVEEEQREVRVARADGDLAMTLHLHENASRYIRQTATPFLDPRTNCVLGYLPSLDSPDLHATRSALVEGLLAQAIYLSGPSAAIADAITDALKAGA
jgi:hypothetical protein